MTFKTDTFLSGLWSSIKDGLASIVFPSKTLSPVKEASEYLLEKLEDSPLFDTDMLLKQILPKPMLIPEDRYKRLNLRLLVGLPPISKQDENPESIKELGGCISWISKNKIDVTELIREIRDN